MSDEDDIFDWLGDGETPTSFMTFPAEPDKFCRVVALAMLKSLDDGIDPLALADVVSQVTSTFVQDWYVTQEEQSTKH